MLNLSDNRVDVADYAHYDCLQEVADRDRPIRKLRIFSIVLAVFCAALFLPWTQNIRAPGRLTTLYPEQRPQTIQNLIPGRIEKWYVREGQFVNAGDTIMKIAEIRDAFFDPELVQRTGYQIEAKTNASINYQEKAQALSRQINALSENRKNKLEQARNRLEQARLLVISDSMDLVAARVDVDIAKQRLDRMEELFRQGLKSLTDLESRRLIMQESQARTVSVENRLLKSKNELINARIELSAVDNEYAEKLSKAESERNSARSDYYDAQGEIAKMENQLSNILMRRNNYFITAPLSGFVTQAISVGIGENIPEGTRIVSIMPERYDFAAEVFIDPVDFPLLKAGTHVRLIFDGWPAVIFSGWPRLSNGTFGGSILAIDNFISDNGKYRILVVPDENDIRWPEDLRVGSGSDAILLLKDVPVWYEVWRQLNGFPPDYYTDINGGEKKPKL